MKVLVLNGSPKGEKSNTLKLAEAFLEGLNSRGANPWETIHIYQKDIGHCRGCFHCWTKTPGKCVLRDDMDHLQEKYLAADLIIWSFPLYYLGMPSKMKAFLDRLLPFNLPFIEVKEDGSCTHPTRCDLSGKKHVLISTCGFCSTNNNYEPLVSQFELLFGDQLTRICCPEGELFSIPQLWARTSEYLAYIKQGGSEYAEQGSISPETRRKLSELLYPPEVFLEMANASWDIKETGSSTSNDESYRLLRQMAALYNPGSLGGKDIVIEIYFTDLQKTYQLWLGPEKCTLRTDSFTQYTTRIETTYTTWLQISEGKLQGAAAMMKGQFKVTGDFNAMLRWDDLFGTNRAAPVDPKPQGRKTNMLLLLLPWLLLWALLPVEQTWGSIGSILACALLPAFSGRWQLTLYEKGSIILVTVTGILGLLQVDQTVLVCLSYLLFGIMWLLSVFAKIPLTAYYSANRYNGKAALQNPLFIKTNRILTGAWGAVYLALSVGSFFLMSGPVAMYTGLINGILPSIMGLFTLWFAKWYPAWVARA